MYMLFARARVPGANEAVIRDSAHHPQPGDLIAK
jgi:hypothetical protein